MLSEGLFYNIWLYAVLFSEACVKRAWRFSACSKVNLAYA
jgi:hypothetical protein